MMESPGLSNMFGGSLLVAPIPEAGPRKRIEKIRSEEPEMMGRIMQAVGGVGYERLKNRKRRRHNPVAG